MAIFCPAPSPDLGLVKGLVASVDCNVQALTAAGYAGLTAPGSMFAAVLTGALTLYIGVLGLRLILGLAPLRMGELTLTAVKIGVVLALSTNWPLYQQLVSDVLLRGPEQLISSALGVKAIGSAPFDGLQRAYDEMQASAGYFAQRSGGATTPFLGGNAFGSFALNSAALVLLMSTLGLMLTVKVVLALLLALGPVFLALFLFDSTRGFFEGWLRAAVATAVAPLFALLGLVFTLIMVQPHLDALAAMRGKEELNLSPAIAVLILSLITAAVSLTGLIAAGVVALGFRPPQRRAQRDAVDQPSVTNAQAETASAILPRAAALASAVQAMERRDSRVETSDSHVRRLSYGAANDTRSAPAWEGGVQTSPLGQTARRSFLPPHAASSRRREA